MLKCEICGKEFKSNLSRHIVVHNISKEEYLNLYPNSKLISDEYSKQRSEISKSIFDDEHREIQRQNLNYQREHTDFCKKQHDGIIKLWQNPEFRERKNAQSGRILTKRNKENWANSEYRAKRIQKSRETATKQWTNPSYREHMLPIILSNIEARNNIQVTEHNGVEYRFRSKLEKQLICKLIDINEPFEYETKHIRYLDTTQNKIRTYIPDLYLPQYNLILEIKPKTLLNDCVVKCKQAACVAQGYNFEFIYNISSLLNVIERFNDYRNHSKQENCL